MEGKSCFLIGHREAAEEVCPALSAAVEEHIVRFGVTEFVVGHYGGFDRFAALAVRRAKRRHGGIRLTLLLPYYPLEEGVHVPDGFDSIFYPPGMELVPRRVAIVRANRYVVDHVDCLIAHVRYSASNANRLLEYAQRRREHSGLHITVLN